SAVNAIPATLGEQGGILKATHGSRTAYEQAATEAGKANTGTTPLTFAWLRRAPTGSGYQVVDAVGPDLTAGQVITDDRVQTIDLALRSPQMVATPVVEPTRLLGFALGPPAAPPGTVLYRETQLGPIKAPAVAESAPFAELAIVIYTSPRADVKQIAASTTTELPLRGDVVNVPLAVGASHWLTS